MPLLIKLLLRQKVDISADCLSGGTLCDETQLILKEQMGFMYSNAPLNEDYQLQDVWKSRENTILDLGEDEFTAGKPHPMIDFSIRNRRIIEEAADPEVAVILLDLVLGFGSNMDPIAEFKPVFQEALKKSPETVIICSITGKEQMVTRKTVAELNQNSRMPVRLSCPQMRKQPNSPVKYSAKQWGN